MSDYTIQYEGQYQSILDQFLEFEVNNELFSLSLNGVLIWERIRHKIFKQTLVEKGLEQKNSVAPTENLSTYIDSLVQWTKSFVFKNPFYRSSSDILFIGTSRRKLREDGQWWDIICDPILDMADLDYIYAEPQFRHTHRKPAKTDNIQYLDFITYTGALQRMFGFTRYKMTKNDRQLIKETQQEFNTEFNTDINFIKIINEKMEKRSSEKWLYKSLLKKIDPNVVVIVVNINKHTLIEACKEKDIPVVELQHGGFGPDHLGYSYPGNRSSSTFPDYLFVFGQFWKDAVDFPIADDHVYSVGYPYLEENKEKFNSEKKNDDIIFISQPTSGEFISKFASNFSERNKEYNIKYKLHPKEYHCWKEYYPWLKNSSLTIIDDDSIPLYQHLSQAQAQVGVNSTVLSEGLIFDLQTYILNAPGHERLSHLINKKAASLISSVSEFENELNEPKEGAEFDVKYLFEPDSIQNIRESMNEVIKKELKP